MDLNVNEILEDDFGKSLYNLSDGERRLTVQSKGNELK